MSRITILLYGTLSYCIFLATFLYAVGFVGGFFVPTALDGVPRVPLWHALIVNLALLTVFALQHSVMARPAFKNWWTQFVPQPAERSTYVLFSSIALIAVFAFWQPMGGTIWDVKSTAGQVLLYGLFAFGWALVLLSTFLINHFDLFGLRQVWLHFKGKDYQPLAFGTPWLYRYVRHPLYVGWLFAFWVTPTMTAAHLLFSIITTLYILVAIRLEEGDLLDAHGDQYAQYQKSVPMLIPRMTTITLSEGGDARPS